MVRRLAISSLAVLLSCDAEPLAHDRLGYLADAVQHATMDAARPSHVVILTRPDAADTVRGSVVMRATFAVHRLDVNQPAIARVGPDTLVIWAERPELFGLQHTLLGSRRIYRVELRTWHNRAGHLERDHFVATVACYGTWCGRWHLTRLVNVQRLTSNA